MENVQNKRLIEKEILGRISNIVFQSSSNSFLITDFGAVGDGVTSNTKAFETAVLKAHEKGGKVIVPAGIWLTGPIRLLSNVELHLEDNALILFDKNPQEYPVIATDYEGIERLRTVSPLYAENAENIAVTGRGCLDGSGHLWRPVKQFKMTERQWNALLKKSSFVIDSKEGGVWMPTESSFRGREVGELYPSDENAIERATPYYDFYRPVMVNFKSCKNVLIQDVTIQNSPAWCVHLWFCENVKVLGTKILNPYHAQNGDGIDIESCTNVEVGHAYFQTGDDGICIKSGKNATARKIPGPCTNIYIHHCYVGQSHGGFVVGSEMSRGVNHVLVEDCTFIDSDVGVRFKSALGRGGVVEDILIRRINMVNMKEEAFIFTMDYVHNIMDYIVEDELSSDDSDIPYFKNIYVDHCHCVNVKRGIKIKGLDGVADTISNIFFEDCVITAAEENELVNCTNIIL